MSRSFEIDPVERITAGAVGEPGERTFFVQARGAGEQITLVAEKEQVRLLAQALLQLLSQLPEREETDGPPAVDLELSEPLEPEWQAGEMSIEYDDTADRVAILLREAGPPVNLEEEEAPPSLDERALARFVATREQARAMAEHSLVVVAAGRPRCRLCGQPLNEGETHVCPSMNGHRAPREPQ